MEPSWTDEQIKDIRGRLIEAKRQGIWLSAAESRMFLVLLTWWQRVSTTGWRKPHEGKLETIAEARGRGIVEIYLFCDAGCQAAGRRIAIADLYRPPRRQALPDTAYFLDIPNMCRFRCIRCGSRNVRMMPAWHPDKAINGNRPELAD